VAGREQRDQLVAQMAVGGWVSLVVALREQEAQHRVAVRLCPATRDDVEQLLVEALDRQPEAPPGAARPEVALHERHRQHPRQGADGVERSVHGVA
jgi:hypothetical protein